MLATLGLTGLTSNAMALIAPGAFLWLTFYIQATTGTTSPSMWIGIVAALLLCLATAIAYAEISKLYPDTGSSYYYAEHALFHSPWGGSCSESLPRFRTGAALCLFHAS
jgi:APA family basic amino acid/polyamine antiporter